MFEKEQLNPWLITASEVKMDTPWVRVQLHQVVTPAGDAGIYGVTEFKNMALGIIPIDEDGFTWLVGQYRLPIDAYSWEIPEGGGPLHIDPLLSAQRELKEETGITAQNWQHLLTMHTSNSATNEVAHLYLATSLSYGNSEPEPTEQLEIVKVHFSQVYQWVLEGKITDSLTVAGILKLKILAMEGFLNPQLNQILSQNDVKSN